MKLSLSKSIVVCALCCCLVWLVSCQTTRVPPGQMVQVVRVVSGQTIEVLDSKGGSPLAERVRLLGIQAPHWKAQSSWSTEAKEQLVKLIGAGKTVRLESDVQPTIERDGSKLRLAYVWLDRQLLNEKLVAGGHVLAQSRSPNHKYEQRLADAQEKARLLGLGIWNPQNPMRQDPGEFD